MQSTFTAIDAIKKVIAPWRWYLRTYVLWIVIGMIFPIIHRAPLQEPQTVQTINTQVCVHTDLKDEVDEWKIQHSLQLVREMGASTIVEFFPWAYFEPQQDQYNWHQADRIIHHAQNQGIKVIARLGLVPAWARPENTTLNYLPPDSYADFTEFAADFADRYAGIVDDIIIWNEPNLAFEWGFQPVNPQNYVDLLEMVYPALHAANPDVTVHAGALAPTLEPEGSPHGLDDLIYLEMMYEAGAAQYFDALAVHSYGLTTPHDATPAPNALNFRRTELVRDMMHRFNDADTPVYITESGWNDDPRWTKSVRPSQRISYTLGAFEWAQQNHDWVNALCVWVLRYPRPTGNYPDNWTLITPEFQLKPIYYALQSYARGWEQEIDSLWLPPPTE